MKNKTLILISIIFTLSFCKNYSKETNSEYYKETQTSFFDLHNNNWLNNEWIRKPKNLKQVHETFKKFGYLELLDKYMNNDILLIQGIYIKKKPSVLIDSLIITYNTGNNTSKYYREFWQRRKKEKNDSIVYEILKDIKFSYKNKFSNQKLSFEADTSYVNDTLLNLLKIEFNMQKPNKQNAIKNINILKKYGFYQSAYNLLYERAEYCNIDWNKDSLKNTLIISKQKTKAWFNDNTK